MFTIQVTGKHSGLVFNIGQYDTREAAEKSLARRIKHVGNANLIRTIIEV